MCYCRDLVEKCESSAPIPLKDDDSPDIALMLTLIYAAVEQSNGEQCAHRAETERQVSQNPGNDMQNLQQARGWSHPRLMSENVC